MYLFSFLAVCLALALFPRKPLAAANASTCDPLKQSTLPRVFILTDIDNEPDDQESLVRLLVHADLYNITGLSAVSSYWLNYTTAPGQINGVISNYSAVRSNLQAHTTGTFPTAEYLHSIVRSGSSSYGLAALQEPLSNASSHLIEVVDSSTEPLYIQAWGGVNVLASALNYLSTSRTPADVNTFVSKLRIYTISDQDNAGFWIRAHYPSLRYTWSLHAWNAYEQSTWSGISNPNIDVGGPDNSLVSKDWLAEHIQIGPFGSTSYPTLAFIMEGDSPSLLFTVQNGLNDPEHPEYGGWGGRYAAVDLSLVSGNHYGDTSDTIVGLDGNTFISNKATIWRWREAYQAEFAARMQWTLPAGNASIQEPPVAIVNQSCGFQPLTIPVDPSQNIVLDASASFSPLDDTLQYSWLHYRDVSLTQTSLIEIPQLNFTCLDGESNVRQSACNCRT